MIAGDDKSGIEFSVTDATGKVYTTGNEKNMRFEIEESGPLRLLLCWEGTHRDPGDRGHFNFLVRLTVYAGCPFVRIDHVFTNRLDPEYTDIKSIKATLPVNVGRDAAYQISDRNFDEPSKYFKASFPLRLMQDDLRHFTISNSSGEVVPRRAGWRFAKGWIDVSGNEAGALLAPKNFWQNFPKAIAADADSITYELLPGMDKLYDIPRSMSKTHTFFVQFHQGQRDPKSRLEMASQLQRWPMPVAPAEYYTQTGQIWDNFACKPEKYPRLESALRNLFFTDHAHFAY